MIDNSNVELNECPIKSYKIPKLAYTKQRKSSGVAVISLEKIMISYWNYLKDLEKFSSSHSGDYSVKMAINFLRIKKHKKNLKKCYSEYKLNRGDTKKVKEIAIKFNVKYADEIDDICQKLYLPKDKSGFIPQFDGYFNLSQTLESVGGGGRGFQMKTAGGQYHLSQIIKQPDVMMLFSYIPNSFSQWEYQVNWDYYEQMCESSSSLTYPVHAICSFDNNQLYKGYKYMCSTARIDIDDIHNCCESGIHAGCSAGAWYGIVRGLLGIEMSYDFVKINPKMLPWWNRITVNLSWHGSDFKIIVDNDGFVITAEGDIRVLYKDKEFEITGGESADFEFERCINEI